MTTGTYASAPVVMGASDSKDQKGHTQSSPRNVLGIVSESIERMLTPRQHQQASQHPHGAEEGYAPVRTLATSVDSTGTGSSSPERLLLHSVREQV